MREDWVRDREKLGRRRRVKNAESALGGVKLIYRMLEMRQWVLLEAIRDDTTPLTVPDITERERDSEMGRRANNEVG
jgi:hypothetical protein